jgi:hypothetical protein
MNVLTMGLVLITSSFLLHVVLWHVRLPKRQTRCLLVIFFAFLALGLGMQHLVPEWLPDWLRLHGLADDFEMSVMVVAMTLAYIITYSALEVDSPSLLIVKFVAERGAQGLPTREFYDNMSDDLLVRPRLQDLVRDQHVQLKEGRYHLTNKGRKFIAIFVFYRIKILQSLVKGG